jgi:hypothetical protein
LWNGYYFAIRLRYSTSLKLCRNQLRRTGLRSTSRGEVLIGPSNKTIPKLRLRLPPVDGIQWTVDGRPRREPGLHFAQQWTVGIQVSFTGGSFRVGIRGVYR